MGLSARVAGATAPRLRAQLTPYALLAPAVLLLGLIVLYPVIRAVGLSFYHYSIQDIKNVEFIGLGNYIELFTDDTLFWDAGRRSITWVGANVVFQLTLGMAFALVLNEDFRGRALMRGLLLLPWVMPSTVAGLMWVFMWDSQFGIINAILLDLNIVEIPIAFLSRPDLSLWAVIVAQIWFGVPFFAIILLAGLQTIPNDYYEAASVDGATVFQRFWWITLPLWRPMIFIATLLRIIWLSQSADLIYIMNYGGPANHSTTIAVYAYVTSIKLLDFGYAAAIAVSLGIVMLVLSYLYLRLARRLDMGLR